MQRDFLIATCTSLPFHLRIFSASNHQKIRKFSPGSASAKKNNVLTKTVMMMVFQSVTQAYSSKGNLPDSSSDALPLSYRRLAGASPFIY